MHQELIEKLMHDLESEWSDNVRSAAHALASLGQPALAPLLKTFQQENEALRRHAAIVLKQMPPSDTMPVLLELLESDQTSSESKLLLLDVLLHLLEERCNDSDLLKSLLALLQEPTPGVRVLIAQALGRFHPSLGVPVLQKLLLDSASDVVEEARRQLSLQPLYSGEVIPSWDTSSYEAAARLRVRNGLSETRVDAMKAMLERREDATAELLPILEDASEQTFEELSPIFKSLDSSLLFHPLTSLIRDRKLSVRRRIAALQTIQVVQGDKQVLSPVLMELLEEESSELRFHALQSLFKLPNVAEASEERNKLLSHLGALLCDQSEELRRQASALLVDVAKASDQVVLRFLLDALHRFSGDFGRAYQMRVLARLTDELPSIQFLLPELLNFVGASHGEALSIGITILEKFVPAKTSSSISDVLLRLAERCEHPDVVAGVLELLHRVLPRNYVAATDTIVAMERRFPENPLWERALRLCGRICDQGSIDTLIRWAEREPSSQDLFERFRVVAREVLSSLEGTLREVWQGVDGRYYHRPASVCQCGGRLVWQENNGREEIRCLECHSEYLWSSNDRLLPLAEVTTPWCVCPGCRRKFLLSQTPQGTWVCPESGEIYSNRFDTKELFRIGGLEHGACKCCEPPQPLERSENRIRCIQTKRSPGESSDNNGLPLIETLELTPFRQSMLNDSAPPTGVPTTRVLQLRKSILPELTEEEEEEP